MKDDTILQVKNLTKYFQTKRGVLHAVEDVSFSIKRGTTLGLVGESGCGKSTTGRLLLNLIPATKGEIIFEGRNILKESKEAARETRKHIQMVFQDPYASLDSRRNVYESIEEPMRIHNLYKNKDDYEQHVFGLMETVGLAPRLINSYPHELDGGRRQRVGIARALSLNPDFIVLDEPVSALDVSIQAQILNLLLKLQKEKGLTYLFISHNLSVVKHISDEVAVMYLGQIVEKAPKKELFENPLHPYTKALLSAVPVPRIDVEMKRILLEGEVPSPINPPEGCRFRTRCRMACPDCAKASPELREIKPEHFIACFKA